MGWSRNLKFVGAACNGLVMKGKSSVIGDALETQLFRAVEAQYVVRAGLPSCCSLLCIRPVTDARSPMAHVLSPVTDVISPVTHVPSSVSVQLQGAACTDQTHRTVLQC